jgi:hypothetical protein
MSSRSTTLSAETIASALVLTILLVVLAGCDKGAVAPTDMSLDVMNTSTLTVTLVVNGSKVDDIAAGQSDHVVAARLPALPWNAQVLSPTRRELLQLTVHAGDVRVTDQSLSGVGHRVDLSCGRIDLWSGPPMLGPIPGSGSPGDCAP